LAYILFKALFASDAVDEVGAFTRNVVFARKGFPCGRTDKSGCFTKGRAKEAL